MGGIHGLAAACGVVALGVTAVVHTAPAPDLSTFAQQGGATPASAPAEVVVAATPSEWVDDDFDGAPVAAPTPPPAPLAEVRNGIAAAPSTVFACSPAASSACGDDALGPLLAECGAVLQQTASACDRDAVQRVLHRDAEFALVRSTVHANDRQSGVVVTPIGVELFAIVASSHAPVQSLTRAQVRKLLTGEATDWSQVGHGAGAVTVFVPAERELAERATRVLVAGDTFGRTCVALSEEELRKAAMQPNALGVVRLNGAPLPAGLRTLSIEWSPPTVDAWRVGAYAYGLPLAVATQGAPAGAAARLLAGARSRDGVAALARAGLQAP